MERTGLGEPHAASIRMRSSSHPGAKRVCESICGTKAVWHCLVLYSTVLCCAVLCWCIVYCIARQLTFRAIARLQQEGRPRPAGLEVGKRSGSTKNRVAQYTIQYIRAVQYNYKTIQYSIINGLTVQYIKSTTQYNTLLACSAMVVPVSRPKRLVQERLNQEPMHKAILNSTIYHTIQPLACSTKVVPVPAGPDVG